MGKGEARQRDNRWQGRGGRSLADREGMRKRRAGCAPCKKVGQTPRARPEEDAQVQGRWGEHEGEDTAFRERSQVQEIHRLCREQGNKENQEDPLRGQQIPAIQGQNPASSLQVGRPRGEETTGELLQSSQREKKTKGSHRQGNRKEQGGLQPKNPKPHLPMVDRFKSRRASRPSASFQPSRPVVPSWHQLAIAMHTMGTSVSRIVKVSLSSAIMAGVLLRAPRHAVQFFPPLQPFARDTTASIPRRKLRW